MMDTTALGQAVSTMVGLTTIAFLVYTALAVGKWAHRSLGGVGSGGFSAADQAYMAETYGEDWANFDSGASARENEAAWAAYEAAQEGIVARDWDEAMEHQNWLLDGEEAMREELYDGLDLDDHDDVPF